MSVSLQVRGAAAGQPAAVDSGKALGQGFLSAFSCLRGCRPAETTCSRAGLSSRDSPRHATPRHAAARVYAELR